MIILAIYGFFTIHQNNYYGLADCPSMSTIIEDKIEIFVQFKLSVTVSLSDELDTFCWNPGLAIIHS